MPYASVDGIQLYFEEHGDGTPLVLVHGFTGSGQDWTDHLPAFTAKHRVVVPDLRGHARSTGPPETIHHRYFAADLVALLDFLEIDWAHFVGHSSGGMCLLFFAIEHPERVRSLALVSATYTFDETARQHMLQIVEVDSLEPDAIEAMQERHGPYHGDDYWQVLREAFRLFTVDPAELPFRPEDLAAIQQPVLILHGDRDPFFPVNIPVTMYRAMPNAELCILPAVGHGLPGESPDLFQTIVTRFLECVEGTESG